MRFLCENRGIEDAQFYKEILLNGQKGNFDANFGKKRPKIAWNHLKISIWSLLDTVVSGTPIVQNGKLVGAITHVFVNDPTKGYAIFAENMLETAQSVVENNKLKEAS